MHVEMNMLTGKYNKVCYEAGDVLVERNHSRDTFLITRVERTGMGFLYHVVNEGDLSRENIMKGRIDLCCTFEPYIESTRFYK